MTSKSRILSALAVFSGVLLAGSLLPGTAYSAEYGLLKANGVSTAADAANYYKTIDPDNLRPNALQWQLVNGFFDSRNTIVTIRGHKNVSDLGFYRAIVMVADQRPGNVGNVAYYTVNYRSESDAVNDSNEVSIVNMEYSPVRPGGERITKFYIYDPAGNLQLKTVFDPNQATAVPLYLPDACAACHGGVENFAVNGGKTGGGFLAFNLNVAQFGSLVTRSSVEAATKLLNQGVLMTAPDSPVKDLISGLYGGKSLPMATQDSTYMPSTWVSEPALYKVLEKDCQGCHTLSAREVLSLNWWHPNADTLRELMFQRKNMPNAPYSNAHFWSTNDHQIALDALNRFQVGPN